MSNPATASGGSRVRVTTEELGSIRLRLSERLRFSLQTFGDQLCYVVEDEQHARYFRIGLPEYMFLSMLDGHTTVHEALARTAVVVGPDTFKDDDCTTICHWLIENQLAAASEAVSAARLHEQQQRKSSVALWSRFNPLSFRIPLGDPTPLLRVVRPVLGWLFRPVGVIGALVLMMVAGVSLFANWQRFATQSVRVVSVDNWAWLGVTWLMLKVCHEMSHGVACLHFGGSVRDCGLSAILGVPLPFVNVTSAWSIPSKWQRMAVGAAGMYIELLIAAVATHYWVRLPAGPASEVCSALMITGGLLTILFNLNPLMRFDGYYLLVDWLEIPNLAHHGQTDVMRLIRRWVFGVKHSPPPWPRRANLPVRLYGCLAVPWRIFVTVSMIFAAEAMFHGAGIVLAGLAVVLWVIVPLVKGLRYVVAGIPGERHSRRRAACLAVVFSVALFAAWHRMQMPEQLVLPAVFDYTPVTVLRTSVPGFVREVVVSDGDFVTAGQIIARLENRDLEFQLADLRTALARSKRMRDYWYSLDDVPAMQIELSNHHSLERRLADALVQQESLSVTAPADGVVIAPEFLSLTGQFLSSGATICRIGDEQTRKVQTLVTAGHIDILRQRIGQPVGVSILGESSRMLTGTLQSVEPSATTTLRHPALAAIAGGPITVRSTDPATSNATVNISASTDETSWEMMEPRFVATVILADEDNARLGAGQLGTVQVTTSRRSFGDFLTATVTDWIRERRAVK